MFTRDALSVFVYHMCLKCLPSSRMHALSGASHWSVDASTVFFSAKRFLLRDADMHSTYLLRRRGWLADWGGWVSVTRRYCIKTAKPIL